MEKKKPTWIVPATPDLEPLGFKVGDPVRMTHPPVTTIASYIDRRLSQAEVNRVNEHLAGCRECTELVANVVKTIPELENREWQKKNRK